ncbi:MAG: glycoside hydrolase family 19 protein, partial [Hyphomicrobium sp.]|nr:glycoside hydrolase family 19 protein [Hyphomicrobium sp.]
MDMLMMRGSSGPAVRKLRQALVRELADDAADFAKLGTGDVLDADVESAVRRWQSGIGIIADGIVGPRCAELLGLVRGAQLALPLGTNEVRVLFPATKPANISRYLPYVLSALAAAGLTDRPMILAALGTIRAESEGFLPISEYPSQFNTVAGKAPFSVYEGLAKLGNKQPGDGAKFRGRGFVHLTGRFNYERFGEAIGVDLASAPDLANAPEIASVLLVQFLAACADPMREALAADDFKGARRLVNGGSHGLDRFRDVFARAATLRLVPVVVKGAAARRRAAAAIAASGATDAPNRQRPLTAR